MFAMPGVGPRPACHIPDPRDSWSLQVGTMVWSCYCKPGCEPVSSVVLENWVLLIAIWKCVSRSHFCFFGIAEVRSYNIALFYCKIGMFWLSLWHGWAKLARANSECTMYTHAPGTGHGLVAPLALCLRLPPAPWPRKIFFQNLGKKDLWNSSYQKKFGKDFFRVWENVLHAGGRATPRVPHPRSQGQLVTASGHCGLVMLL